MSFNEDDEDDTEFYDAQEGETAAEEELTPLQKLMAEFPAIDEYTGVNNGLDMQRADIIKDLMYCFIYSLSNGKEHSQYQTLIKKYNRIQKKRERLAQLAQEKLKERSAQDSFSSWSPRNRTVENDIDDDFGDYESFSSREKRSGSGEHGSSHGMSSPVSGNIRRSDRSFDW
ncbi:MAG: hypothetical protein Q8Q60_01875 [Candidatus Chromulinivorax sp.]|nr:hypothetical protein [Candidatus Chromulinivorax sp.]